MPEVDFQVRWPDGTTQDCVSPSRTIEAALTPGARYPVGEFVRRSTEALSAGSERVRERYGFHCTAAAAQADDLTREAARFAGDAGVVTVERMGMRERAIAPRELGGHVPVVIIGGGQAGLSASWFLTQDGVEHVVLERGRTGHAWRNERWDSFCLVTPNWQCDLPGHPYAGGDPDGFMVREEILGYLDAFRRSFDPPVHEEVAVLRVGRAPEAAAREAGAGLDADLAALADGTTAAPSTAGPFTVETNAGTLTCDQVILAVGGYHVPTLPTIAGQIPPHITQLHSQHYKRAAALPDGGVLVIGTGQSGAQIAEDLHLAGRDVHVAVGTAPRVARFHRGRDVVAWLHDMGHYDRSIEDHPEGTKARKEANHYVTGRGGGRDIDLRRFATEGMTLHGRLEAVSGSELQFADDLQANLDGADATYNRINATIDAWIEQQGIEAPPTEPYEPSWAPPAGQPLGLDLDALGIRTIIWATGFRSHWSWVDLPIFDERREPVHERGLTAVDGVAFLGLPWLHTWGSGRFASIKRDAQFVTANIAARALAR